MDDIVKTYTIPTNRFTERLFRRWAAVTGRMNSRKIGRTRRGGLLFVGGSVNHNEDGTTTVTLRMQKRPAALRVPIAAGVKKFCLYGHAHIGKLMKDLVVAGSKA